MIKLLYGRSGSGKTARMLEQMKELVLRGEQVLYIIPEQQHYTVEYYIATEFPSGSARYLRILSFSDLADTVKASLGGGNVPTVSRAMQSVIMYKSLKELSGTLTLYDQLKATSSAVRSLVSAAEDFRVNDITPEFLEEACGKVPADTPLHGKLTDLAAICTVYNENLRKCCAGQSHDELVRAALMLQADKELFAGVHVFADSFTMFTAPEFLLLTELYRKAADLTVSLCGDPDQDEGQFETSARTKNRLKDLASRLGRPFILEKTYPAQNADSPLAYLEKNLWNFEREPYAGSGEAKDVFRVLRCPNPYAEAELAAIHVLELIQSGMRYKDIAVIARDAKTYRGIIDAAFEKYGIPHFLSERINLNVKPLVRLILSAVRATEGGWRAEDILSLAKTGLCGVRPQDIQLFASYCETWKIRGSMFANLDEKWTMNPDGYTQKLTNRGKYILKIVNQVRKDIMTPLRALHAALHGADNLSQMCRALCDYLRALRMTERLDALSRDELSAGRWRDASDTLRIFDEVLGTVHDLSLLLPDEKIGISEFSVLLSLIFSEADMGNVPQNRDCVIIGSASALRTEKVRAVLLIGLNDGLFPMSASSDGLLTRQDKDQLQSYGVDMHTQSDMSSFDELFYLYRSVTRAGEKLWMSYHESGGTDTGKPSIAVLRICHLFPSVKTEVFRPLALRSVPVKETPDVPAQMDIRTQIGDRIRLTQTSIQRFAECPYSYYCQHILKLHENRPAAVDPANAGTFIHAVLERLVSEFVSGGQLALPTPDRMHERLDEIADEYVKGILFKEVPNRTRQLHLFRRLRNLARIMADSLLGEFSSSLFVPHFFELPIGTKKDGRTALPAVMISSGTGGGPRIEFSGIVDRVDMWQDKGESYLRIVDYKTGKKSLSFAQIQKGQDMQLLLYMAALTSAGNAGSGLLPANPKPAGVSYLYLDNDKPGRDSLIINSNDILEAWNTDKSLLDPKAKGLVSQQAFLDLENQVIDTVRQVGNDIYNGKCERTPSPEACRFCPVAEGCPVRSRERRS
ncbi:MAG: exodeoxyribonuclease V subunit gamma [Clostridia bacterium]|nr:exodeoxyribonuclease V subunit gamma [Clostridia bacterium]